MQRGWHHPGGNGNWGRKHFSLQPDSPPPSPIPVLPPLRTCSATLWYTYMALTNMQMEVQALETLATASGVNSSIWMYGSTWASKCEREVWDRVRGGRGNTREAEARIVEVYRL